MKSRTEQHQETTLAKDFSDVSTHFRIPIISGTSLFTVKVPHHHLQESRRRFFFNELHLTPDFYSLEAEKLKLDADTVMVEQDAELKVYLDSPSTVYGPTGYINKTGTKTTDDFIANINAFFEANKPNFAYASPFFIDWVDASIEEGQDLNETVPALSRTYYNETFNAIRHQDHLPSSVRDIKGVNNFLPPLGTMASQSAFEEKIRLRFWMGPFSKCIFSSIVPFTADMGFSLQQMGKSYKNQYHLLNDKPHWTIMAVASAAPSLNLTKTDFKVTLEASGSPLINRLEHIQMGKLDWRDDAQLSASLVESFKQASRGLNVKMSLAFEETEKLYQFQFPTESTVHMTVLCQPELAHRLGFGFVPAITKGMEAKPQTEKTTVDEVLAKSMAIVYDTGPIVCTLDQAASNTTSGTLDLTMAALYPRSSGTLSMPPLTRWPPCTSASALEINIIRNASDPLVPVTFRLLRIYDDQSIRDFAWNCDAYIYGELQGCVCD